MATKTISITEDAYERLCTKKHAHESFSEVINRITNKVNLSDFAGILSETEADAVLAKISKARALSRKRISRKLKL
ncbi:antitoxin VapB family protein [Candidatus Woesearchaeota archaeon]|nr:antitoxin VapB family protein [Candidatus Woesearchaeota archaeon]